MALRLTYKGPKPRACFINIFTLCHDQQYLSVAYAIEIICPSYSLKHENEAIHSKFTCYILQRPLIRIQYFIILYRTGCTSHLSREFVRQIQFCFIANFLAVVSFCYYSKLLSVDLSPFASRLFSSCLRFCPMRSLEATVEILYDSVRWLVSIDFSP